MSAEEQPDRPNRRATDLGPGDNPRARRRRLVQMISSDRELVAWLGTTKARTLSSVAADLTAAGHTAAAELVQRKANDLASGNISPF